MTAQELYETDFFQWTRRNAELLSQGRLDLADIPHIAEELADIGKRDRRRVAGHLRRLIARLLLWEMQPGRRRDSWLSRIGDARAELKLYFKYSPSLRWFARESVSRIYENARHLASTETGLPIAAFPAECPYRFEQLTEMEFLPGVKRTKIES
ncbi:MAG TPA: DUF29 domain-containing protein [Bryobacteraceae bacterium]|jgi:hypothetical protein